MRRIKGLLLAVLLLCGSSSVFASDCDLQCACYTATFRMGKCQTISDNGCVVIYCM